MCLAVPGEILEIKGDKGKADFGGVKREVDLSFLKGVKVGDFVLVHVGFAIQKVDQKVARESYRLLAELDKEMGKDERAAK